MITRIKITNFRGIKELDRVVGPAGIAIKGQNGGGKSSVLKAIKAALLAQDIGPDAIRRGSDKAEILIDVDAIQARRVITAKATTLTVTKDGFKAPSPLAFLRDLLGVSELNPLRLIEEADTAEKRRRRMDAIFSAMPITTTVEQLRQWVPKLSDNFDCSGHGLEVVERLRAKAYEQRSEANRVAKAARGEVTAAIAEVERLEASSPLDEPRLADAQEAADGAKRVLVELQGRAAEAEKAHARTAHSRAKVEALRKRAAAALERGGANAFIGDEELNAQRTLITETRATVEKLRAELAEAERHARQATEELAGMLDQNRIAQANQDEADDCERQAADIEATIAAASGDPIAPEALETARAAERAAIEALESTRSASERYHSAQRARTAAESAQEKSDEAAAEAVRLDTIVRALTVDAPRELIAQANGIPGLTLEGDDILLDGVSLDRGCCGLEKIRFAVEVAKRASPKGRILIVDGAEALDPDQYGAFVKEATRDGWQLIVSRVEKGEVVIEAIVAVAA